jgi:hypothetical protein
VAVGLFKRDARTQASDPKTFEVHAIKLRGGSEVPVVGESHYQQALLRICGGKSIDGHHRGCIAALIREPHNEYDRHAVAVQIDAQKVGYLSRDDARAYGLLLERLASEGCVGACDAEIRGGWNRGGGDEGHFGVVLFLAPPRYCHPDDPAPPPPPPRAARQSAPHTGASSSPRLDVGMVRRKHYTDWVETVKDLKRLGHYEQARDLLLELCEAVEDEGTATGMAVPPWYFEQTAIVCRRLKDYDGEVAILERYLANPRAVRGNFGARLEKARAKAGKPLPPPLSVEPVAAVTPGWYQDPWGDATVLRYHDGSQWTGHLAPRHR